MTSLYRVQDITTFKLGLQKTMCNEKTETVQRKTANFANFVRKINNTWVNLVGSYKVNGIQISHCNVAGKSS